MRWKRVALVLSTVLVLGAATAALFVLFRSQPLLFADAFERIEVGMARADAERLVRMPEDDRADDPLATDFASAVWQGRLDDGTHRLSVAHEPDFDTHPLLNRSRFVRWPLDAESHVEEDDAFLYVNRATRAVLGRERVWLAGAEELVLIYDADNRVAEKVHIIYRTRPQWLDSIVIALEDLLDGVWLIRVGAG